MLTLREYRPQDFERLLEIDTACFVEGIAYSQEEMHYFLSRPAGIVLVGEEAGDSGSKRILGFVIADHFRARRSRQRMGRIITIDVLPEAQRRRLGSHLLIAAEGKLKDIGCGYVSLETAVDNFAALRFYKKQGYVGLRILPRYYLDSLDALQMGKEI